MPVEWWRRAQFAEVAETLGVDTKDVVGMVPDNLVIYTSGEDASMLWSAELERDEDGILHVTSTRAHPQVIERLWKEFHGE
jgi:hypothetical protein